MTQGATETPAQLISVPEAAQLLGVSRDYMYRLVRSGEVKAIRLPGMRGGQRGSLGWGTRIERSELDAFIERHRVNGGS